MKNKMYLIFRQTVLLLLLMTMLIGNAVPALAASKINIPDPSDYFTGSLSQKKSSDAVQYHFTDSSYDKQPETAIEKYIDALKSSGLKLTKRSTVEYKGAVSGKRYELSVDDELAVELYWIKGSKKMKVSVFSDVCAVSSGTQKTTLGKNVTVVNKKIKDGQLPDIGLFLNCSRNEDQDSDGTSWLCSYYFTMDNGGMEAVEEVLALLQRPEYHLELRETVVLDYTKVAAHKFDNYYFDYTGSKKVGNHIDTIGDWERKNIVSNVRINVAYYYDRGTIGLSYYFGDGFKLVDCGEKTDYQLIDYSGNGSDNYISTYDNGNKHTVQCNVCDGTGDCQRCGGSGYLYSRASDKEDRNCSACHLDRGKCFSCRGDGWLN